MLSKSLGPTSAWNYGETRNENVLKSQRNTEVKGVELAIRHDEDHMPAFLRHHHY